MSGSKEKKVKIMQSKKYGFTLYQQNGQRTFGGPPPNWGSRPPPSRDCEVFIGRLPRMCFEDELIPLFLSAGELYEFRLMLDFSGTNRGYGYAHYATPAGAAKAIKTLHKFEIRPGHQIGVLKSKNNCRLLFGNIGLAMNVEDFKEFICTATDQVLKVIMFRSFQQLNTTDFSISAEVEEAFLGRMPRNIGNNQFAIVEYENHKAAAVARRVLIPKYGQILAIDWAVPPRERKNFVSGLNAQKSVIERPLLRSNSTSQDMEILCSAKITSKVRPVPLLIVQPSHLDNVPFMPKTFQTVVKFFKYQISICLYKSVNQSEISLLTCKEIEKKIVDRITNLENCSQAVQLIFNYFSWHNEKKRFFINTEVQKLLQEVKTYADSFVHFVNNRIAYGPSANLTEDVYFTNTLPLQLNVLFRIILLSNIENQAKWSSGITRSLNWLTEVVQKGDKSWKEFVEKAMRLIEEQDPAAIDVASNLSKTAFLNAITANVPCPSPEASVDILFRDHGQLKCFEANLNPYFRPLESPTTSDTASRRSSESEFSLQKLLPDTNQQWLKADAGHYVPMPFSQLIKSEGEITSSSQPSVPFLVVRPSSVMNNIPFVPKIFNNVLHYFKHLIKVSVATLSNQLELPQNISNEVESKIINQISDLESCGEGAQLLLSYFSWWIEKKPCLVKQEVLNLLQEVKAYSESFVRFAWNQSHVGYVPNPALESFFYKELPLRLNLLYQMMLIFNSENPMRYSVGILKGLHWLEELIQNGDKTAKEFIEELTRFVLTSDPKFQENAKNLGKTLCTEMMISSGQPLLYLGPDFPFNVKLKQLNKNGLSKSSATSSSGCLTSGSFSTLKDETSTKES